MLKRIASLLALSACFYSISGHAEDTPNRFLHPFYVGITGGYGSTTWNGLVPPLEKQDAAILMSTPTEVEEGGGIWGIVLGYEVIPFFAVEGSYTHFPNATVYFDPQSLVTFENDGLTQLTTRTESMAVMGKFMLLIPHTGVRAFSSAGIARVHRDDELRESWRISPTFSVGFNYNFTDRIMGEIGFNYTGGYGESEIDPAEDYVPFLYAGFIHLAYRFG